MIVRRRRARPARSAGSASTPAVRSGISRKLSRAAVSAPAAPVAHFLRISTVTILAVPLLAFMILAVLGVGSPPALHAQDATSSWNDARALDLVRGAREVRRSASVDEALSTYQADVRGYVYFFIDRPDREDHVLVKADQVALELYWQAPGSAKQRIVGQRDEEVLPTSIRYHMDHLTVVQDDFGDRIRLGDGDEVAAVPHPMAPGSESVYDFQLVDSLSLSYGSDGEEVRVYEIQVRPKDLNRAAYVGTVFVDRATSAIVRMNFSFTPASYVDPYLDYIRISLDNSLWMGRYWLPYRQEIELRREMPVLDFAAGSVIRSRFDISGYDFNVELAESLFRGPRVSAVSPSQRAEFAFERGLFDEIDEEGLTVSTTMEDVRAQVREVVEDEVLSGLAPIRLSFDGLSDFARYNRAEGVFVGGGLTFRPRGDLRLRTAAGYAFGRKRASGRMRLTAREGLGPTLGVYWDELGDVGGNQGATPLVNTMSAASGDKDYLDPFFRRGATLTLGRSTAGEGSSISFTWEDQRSARDVVSDGPDAGFRPVGSIVEGSLAAVSLSRGFMLPGSGSAVASSTVGNIASRTFTSTHASAEWLIGEPREAVRTEISVEGALSGTRAPVQALHLIGGRHTMPGQPYRGFIGNVYWLGRAVTTVPVRPPYVGLRAFGVVGATYLNDSVTLPADWTLPTTDGLRGSIGLGLSIGWDTLYFDVGHGVRGGTWEAVFSVSEQFAGWM